MYARFSSENQRDRSIEDQVQLCKDNVERREGTIREDMLLTDYAVSGVSNTRAGFDKLLQLIDRRAIDVVVTESLDRLSRDLGDADRLWKIAKFNDVRLICVSDGIDSARDGSRLQFAFKAVMSDEYLADLSKKTRRGLYGAARKGRATGGLPYGYDSRPIWDGGREPGGYEILISEEQAVVVVRIFEMYRDGYSILSIATRLNDDGVEPPRARSKKNPTRFWKKGTIREMLRNRAYIGHWTFGRKRWHKCPVTRKRRYKRNPASEVFEKYRPHLRIIESELWEAVQERLEAVAAKYKGNGGAPGARTAHPFSGLLACGSCGAPMVNAGGSSAVYYRCSGAHSGGTCDNDRPVREDVLLAAALAELKRVVTDTDLLDEVRSRIAQRLKSFKLTADDEHQRLAKQIGRLDAEVQNLVSFIRTTDSASSPGSFDAVRDSLERATNERRQLHDRLQRLERRRKVPPKLPTVEDIMALILDIEARLKEDPTTAREAIRRMLDGGRIAMHPQPDGTYKAESVIFPLKLAWKTRRRKSKKPRKSDTSEASEVVENDGCAGAIVGLEHAISLGFEVTLVA